MAGLASFQRVWEMGFLPRDGHHSEFPGELQNVAEEDEEDSPTRPLLVAREQGVFSLA